MAINTSLMTLGRCLEALRWNQTHLDSVPRLVPYRESKITHLFRDALHGWGQILLSVNVSPVACDYDETSHVLKVTLYHSEQLRLLRAFVRTHSCGQHYIVTHVDRRDDEGELTVVP